MLVTQEQIFEKLESIEKKLDKILQQVNDFELESLSIGKTAKLLHVGEYTIKKLIQNNQLQAFKINSVTRVKLSEIKRFQNSEPINRFLLTETCESAEDIAKRVFSKKERKAS